VVTAQVLQVRPGHRGRPVGQLRVRALQALPARREDRVPEQGPGRVLPLSGKQVQAGRFDCSRQGATPRPKLVLRYTTLFSWEVLQSLIAGRRL
jgi:hypothetical protein